MLETGEFKKELRDQDMVKVKNGFSNKNVER